MFMGSGLLKRIVDEGGLGNGLGEFDEGVEFVEGVAAIEGGLGFDKRGFEITRLGGEGGGGVEQDGIAARAFEVAT